MSEKPDMTNGQIKKLLCETAQDLGMESSRQGFGRLDVNQLLRAVNTLTK